MPQRGGRLAARRHVMKLRHLVFAGTPLVFLLLGWLPLIESGDSQLPFAATDRNFASPCRTKSSLLAAGSLAQAAAHGGSDSIAANDLSQVMDFVRAGPLWSSLSTQPDPAEWGSRGSSLVALLTGNSSSRSNGIFSVRFSDLDVATAVRVYHLYLPIYFWMRDVVCANLGREGGKRNAVVVGMSAPQGCGKSTLVEFLIHLFAADGMSSVGVSIDDFLREGAEQDAIASAHPSNELLQVRGNAGTHDVQLGRRIVQALATASEGDVSVPVYDKGARGGKGDRMPEQQWRRVQVPYDVVLLEGWMLGFKARGDGESLAAIHPGLPEIDANLEEYQRWDEMMDAWCVIKASDINNVFEWRLEAEQRMRAAGRGGMSDKAVHDFVARYMPAYAAYCPALHEAAARDGVDGKPTLAVEVGGKREPVGAIREEAGL